MWPSGHGICPERNVPTRGHIAKFSVVTGGWFCFDHKTCMDRWHGSRDLMSSRDWTPEIHGRSPWEGFFLLNLPTIQAGGEPITCMCRTVRVIYGAVSEKPQIQVKHSSSIYHKVLNVNLSGDFSFLGSRIVDEVVKDLLLQGLFEAKFLLLAGSSAGGVGVMLNVDRTARRLNPRTDVRALADSGWFLDLAPYRPVKCDSPSACEPALAVQKGHHSPSGAWLDKQLLAEILMSRCVSLWQGKLPQRCVDRHKSEPWRCYLGYKIYPTLQSPLFVFQWLFDEAQMSIGNVGTPTSKAQWDYIHHMGSELRNSLSNVTAVFSPACVAHSIITKSEWTSVKVGPLSLPQALVCWEAARIRRRKHPGLSNRSLHSNGSLTDSLAQKKRQARRKRKREFRKNKKRQQKNKKRRKKTKTDVETECPAALDTCSWPQCNRNCPRLHDPATGAAVDFVGLLKSFGLDLGSVANALGVDPATLEDMDHEALLQLLAQQTS
ncbi:NOTUM [Cordylochernes scorpioides]|uniref:NOTUM n=1 Tax=Cordylochernes scorpioides TaxID=51811 RepID=A0ABY6LDT1_9ARAC|nr:NOTUM [Cordylochernes scorpioides]